ncbi:MAG: histidine--tRNA ligase [Saprospiraceae bacterium]
MAQKPGLAKGTRDFLPEQARKRKYIFRVIEEEFILAGYQPLETPAMENLSTLTGKYGDEGDKLLFRILNSGEFLKDLSEDQRMNLSASEMSVLICEKGLRYDLTVPMARAVVMNRHLISFPFKRYQIQPVWRADRPQRGRYREFYQCDADVIGSDSLLYEAELMLIYLKVFNRLGIPVKVLYNHRKILEGLALQAGREDLFVPMTIALDKLDKIGNDGVIEELTKAGFTRDKALDLLKRIGEGSMNSFQENLVMSKGIDELNKIWSFISNHPLSAGGLQFSPSLARGLSYYTGTIFEVVPTSVSMGSLGGGGRYDNLTGVFGMEGTSGVGISFGADRIYDVMEELGLFPDELNKPLTLLFLCLDESSQAYAFDLCCSLRDEGIAADVYPEHGKLKKQWKYAEDIRASYTIVIGEDERHKGSFQLKNQSTGMSTECNRSELMMTLKH